MRAVSIFITGEIFAREIFADRDGGRRGTKFQQLVFRINAAVKYSNTDAAAIQTVFLVVIILVVIILAPPRTSFAPVATWA